MKPWEVRAFVGFLVASAIAEKITGWPWVSLVVVCIGALWVAFLAGRLRQR